MRVALAMVGLAALCGALVACGEDKVETGAGSSSAPPPPPRGTAAIAALSDAGAPPPQEFTENDFAESDRNRDPFRSFASMFVEQKKGPVRSQLNTLLSQYSVDELKLVAIVLSGDYPRAMMKDPSGRGWVIRKGDYIGRAEVVHSGGQNGTDYMLNWRVDRVRDGDVVLVREDPGQPNIAPATRVIPLHTEAEKERERLQD